MIPIKHLVLHFDVNETILIGDVAGGDSFEESLNKVLAKSAAVQIRGGEQISRQEPTHWWDGTPILDYSTTATAPPPALHPKWVWPEGGCPYYRTAYRKRSKNFVNHHGSIYKNVYDRMHSILTKPLEYHPVFANIIPSFFYMLHDLYTQPEKYAFDDLSIVFRTFGSDLHDVRQAVHMFASGQHPEFPDFVEPRLQKSEASAFVQGRWVQSNRPNVFEYQLVLDDGTAIASGDSEVLHFLHSHSFCGIQDDWHHWSAYNCEPWAGKQVWIPFCETNADRQYHHVLFDDNIHNLIDDSIAGIRREVKPGVFESLNGHEVLQQQGKHLIKVHTLLPILDKKWFLDEITKVLCQF